MQTLPSVSLSISVRGDALRFHLTYERNWLAIGIHLIVICGTAWAAIAEHSLLGMGTAMLFALWLIADHVQGTNAELTVTNDEMLATGNLGRPFRTKLKFYTSDIVGIEYGGSGDDSSQDGLYVRRKLDRVLVLKGLSQEMCAEIIGTIDRNFPDFGTGDTDPESLLFGKRTEPITLKLSGRE